MTDAAGPLDEWPIWVEVDEEKMNAELDAEEEMFKAIFKNYLGANLDTEDDDEDGTAEVAR